MKALKLLTVFLMELIHTVLQRQIKKLHFLKIQMEVSFGPKSSMK